MSKAKLVLAEVTIKPTTSQRKILVRRGEPVYQVLETHNLPNLSPQVNARFTWSEFDQTYPGLRQKITVEISQTIFIDWASYRLLDKDGNPIN